MSEFDSLLSSLDSPADNEPAGEFDSMFKTLDTKFEPIRQKLEADDLIRQDNIANKGNFKRGLASGWDSTVGLLGGAVGLAGDAMGLDSVRDWGFDTYEERNQEASLNPVDVQNFTDIESVSDAGSWFAGTIGQLAPSMGEALVSTIVGGGVAGLAGRTLAKEAIETAVERQVASGIKREVANKLVIQNIKRIGANVGMVGGVGALEGGGMWGEDAAEHGVENANAGSAAALGLVSGASELYSPGGMLVKRIAGIKGTGSAVGGKIADTFLKRLGTEIPKQMGGEAAQEVFQSFLGILNKKIQDPTVSLSDKTAIHEYINSGAAGAAGGLLFGGTSAVFPESTEPQFKDPFNIVQPEKKPALDIDEAEEEFRTPGDVFAEWDSQASISGAMDKQAITTGPPAEVPEELAFLNQSLFDRQAANTTGQIDPNERAYDRGLLQGGVADYSPDLPPMTKAGYDPLMDEWADDAVSLGADEADRGRHNAPLALPPGGQFELTGQAYGPKDGLPASTHTKIDRAKVAADPAFQRMKDQMKESDSGGVSYNAEAAEKDTYEMTKSTTSHVVVEKSTNPEWLKLKTLQKLDKENSSNLAKEVNKAMVNHVFKLVEEGKPLTEKQSRVFSYMKEAAAELGKNDQELVAGQEYDKLAGEGFEFGKPEMVAAGTLKPGDQVVLKKNGIPDKVTHQGFDKDGNAILKDGVTLHVDPFEEIEVHARKDGQEKADPAVAAWVVDIVGKIKEGGTQADLERIRKEIPSFLEHNPKMAPYKEMLTGAIDKREAVLDGDTRAKAPGTAGFQGGSIDAVVADTKADISLRTSAPGSRMQAEIAKLKGTAVEVIDNPDSVAHGHEINTAPSEAQKDAGNYQKSHVKLDGLDISIENPAGSTRSGTNKAGKTWETEMKADYGYIKGSVGYDKDHVDVFIAPGYQGGGEDVYVVNQHNKDGAFDEHKAVMGSSSEDEAMQVYNSNYEAGWTGGKSVVRMSMEKFREWSKSEEPKKGAVKAGMSADVAKLKEGGLSIPSSRPILHSFHNAEDGVTAVVTERDAGGYAVSLYDNDAEKYVPTGHFFKDEGEARKKAESIANVIHPVETKPVVSTGTAVDETQTSEPIVEHITKKGKVIRGVIRKGITKEQAKEIDPYTWAKDGGFFIREQHLKKDPGYQKNETSEDSTVETDKGIVEQEATQEGMSKPMDPVSVAEDKYPMRAEVEKLKAGKDERPAILKELRARLSGLAERALNAGDGKLSGGIRSFATNIKEAESDIFYSTITRAKADEVVAGKEKIVAALEKKKPAAPKPSGNMLVSDERFEEVKRLLRAKLNNLNSGLDPEMILFGTELAVGHIERGARSFVKYAKLVIADLGDQFRPFLKMWYNSARDYPGIDNSGMDDYHAVSGIDVNSSFDEKDIEPTKKTEPDKKESNVRVEYDGEEMPADEALAAVDAHIQKMYELLGCLK